VVRRLERCPRPGIGRAASPRAAASPRDVSRLRFGLVTASLVRARLDALSERYALPPGAGDRLATLLDLVAAEPASITSVRDPADGVSMHVADSLVALELDVVRAARQIADLGSGGGFPGLVLAIALPEAKVALVESVGRKAAFLERASTSLGLANVTVVNERAESWRAGLGGQDVVTARALAPLGVLVEYAAPLLAEGGALVAWKGRRDPGEERDAAVAAEALGMTTPASRAVQPFDGATARSLYLSLKVASTPPGYPRRPGMARKRPFRRSG
jgi:16S rRNA (guanine527-N7)-methyltransferase